jgi:hypothetical protein
MILPSLLWSPFVSSSFRAGEFILKQFLYQLCDYQLSVKLRFMEVITVVGTKLCVPHPSSKRQEDQKGGAVADEETFSVHNINFISQWQYFVARCLISCVGNVFGLRSVCACFPSTCKLVT